MITARKYLPATVLFSAFTIAALPVLVACSGSDGTAVADSSLSDSVAATESEDSDFGFGVSSDSGGAESAAANIDVCSLLSESDAFAVADSAGLAGGTASGVTYSLTKQKQEYDPSTLEYSPRSGCRFVFDADGYNTGVVSIETIPADSWDLYAGDGTPIDDLGDEAVTNAGTSYVRVGDVMLTTGENTFTDDFVVELYRAMAPNL